VTSMPASCYGTMVTIRNSVTAILSSVCLSSWKGYAVSSLLTAYANMGCSPHTIKPAPCETSVLCCCAMHWTAPILSSGMVCNTTVNPPCIFRRISIQLNKASPLYTNTSWKCNFCNTTVIDIINILLQAKMHSLSNTSHLAMYPWSPRY
jgi:hypothetical protein